MGNTLDLDFKRVTNYEFDCPNTTDLPTTNPNITDSSLLNSDDTETVEATNTTAELVDNPSLETTLSFREVVNRCLEKGLDNPKFSIIKGDGESIKMSFFIKEIQANYQDDNSSFLVKISEVNFNRKNGDSTTEYWSLPEHYVEYYVDDNILRGDLLLSSNHTLDGVYWFQQILSWFFEESAKIQDIYKLILSHKSEFNTYRFTTDNVDEAICLWCGIKHDSLVTNEFCKKCIVCFDCGSRENLQFFDQGSILCYDCYEYLELKVRFTGGDIGYPINMYDQ